MSAKWQAATKSTVVLCIACFTFAAVAADKPPKFSKKLPAVEGIGGLDGECYLDDKARVRIELINNSRVALSKAIVETHYIIPGRSKPHFSTSHERRFDGGLEPGETADVSLVTLKDYESRQFQEAPGECVIVVVIAGIDDFAEKAVKYRDPKASPELIKRLGEQGRHTATLADIEAHRQKLFSLPGRQRQLKFGELPPGNPFENEGR